MVRESLREVGIGSALRLLATYAGDAAGLEAWLQDGEINMDRNLRLQYLAGVQSTLFQQDAIYSELLSYRRFPGRLFVGSHEWLDSLRQLIERPNTTK